MLYDIPCVILCGGKSSRMGEDKSLLPFNGTATLAQYQYTKLSKLFKNVYLSAKSNKFDFIDDNKIILDNQQNNSSPMIALDSIFDYLQKSRVFIITVDTPLVQNSTIHTLIKASDGFEITTAKDTNKNHNLCGVFSNSISKYIKILLQQDIHKINYLIKKNTNYQEILFKNYEQFININDINDYKKACNIINYFD